MGRPPQDQYHKRRKPHAHLENTYTTELEFMSTCSPIMEGFVFQALFKSCRAQNGEDEVEDSTSATARFLRQKAVHTSGWRTDI